MTFDPNYIIYQFSLFLHNYFPQEVCDVVTTTQFMLAPLLVVEPMLCSLDSPPCTCAYMLKNLFENHEENMVTHFNNSSQSPICSTFCCNMLFNSFSSYLFCYKTQFCCSFGLLIFLLFSFVCSDFLYNYLFHCFLRKFMYLELVRTCD